MNKLKILFKMSFWRFSVPFFMSLWYEDRKQYHKSIDILNRIIQKMPETRCLNLVYTELGINYARLEDFMTAESCLLKALQYEPNGKNGLACMWLGYVYMSMSDYQKSIDYFKQTQILGSSGRDKLVVNLEYVQRMINKADENMRLQLNDILNEE